MTPATDCAPRDGTARLTIHDVRERASAALRDGRITQDEYTYFLAHAHEHYGATTREPASGSDASRVRSGAGLLVGILLLVALAAAWFLPSGLTGLAAYDALAGARTFTEPGQIPLDAGPIASVRISGTLLDGAGTVTLVTPDATYLVWNGTATLAPSIWTDQLSYALGETVTASVLSLPVGETASIAITTPDGTRIADSTIIATQPGTYTVDALIGTTDVVKLSDTLVVREDTDPTADMARTPPQPTAIFTDVCDQTCELALTGEAQLAIDVTPGATLILETVTVTTPENAPPVFGAPLPDVTLVVGESVAVDLDEHFTDPDGDALVYDAGATTVAQLSVENGVLTITGIAQGDATMMVYASDLRELVESNTVRITVLAPDTGTNTTLPDGNTTNDTGNATNVTSNATVERNGTNATLNATPTPTSPSSCADPDPNLRPLECLNPAEYFQDQTIYITTTERAPVARITPIGNLLLTGDVHERASFTPRTGDYTIGYEETTGAVRATVWFDSETGDLYLSGVVLEENANSDPAPGSFVLRNRKGIVLLWANPSTGDLFLRGNLITGKRSIEVR